MNHDTIFSFSDPRASLDTVGGKGASLSRLYNAGLPVPDGFHLTTSAYRAFVANHDLQPFIVEALRGADLSRPSTLEQASQAIHDRFLQAQLPEEIERAIIQAYHTLPGEEPAVAVRSSATAEDLPEASFAGQQETYLNVRGEAALQAAVKKCWASLWTARAIAYRMRNAIDQNSVALAVVVQQMVNAEAAGILFTANPLNGRRDEMVINAAWGLGEAIVGGLVSPDTIVVDKQTCKIKTMEVAEKAVRTVLADTGTREEALNGARRGSAVLNETQVTELARLARRIEALYGKPQDIEWCYAGGRFSIVQSRPVTTLAEAPIEWAPPDPKGTYMRSGMADIMPGPLSPLFISWAIPTLRQQMKPLGIRLTRIEPVLMDDYYTAINTYAYMNASFPLKSWGWILTGLLPSYPGLLRRLVPFWRDELHPEYQAFVARYHGKSPEKMMVVELWQDAQDILAAAMYYACGLLFATMGASAGSEGLLTQVYRKFARQAGDPEADVMLMGWDNIPVRADKALYDMAAWARENETLASYLLETPAVELAERLSSLPRVREETEVEGFAEFASRFKAYLETFGHIVFQLDFAEPLPLDNPAMLLETVKMYLRGQGANPHLRQKASEERRIQMVETMRQRLKGLKRWAFEKALRWGQSMAEVREDALAEIGIGYPILRAMLRELGSRFAAAGAIRQADDIFWLEKDEVSACVSRLEGGEGLENLSARVDERKAFNRRAKEAAPPPIMPMKKRIMGIKTDVFLAQSGANQAGSVLKGIPTSAGKVTAPACVLRGAEDFNQMRPGSVLVAGATTPAWTPLFAMASAVVTDIGGPLSHGSIVAREYGIPAVMGTGSATRRIQTGQIITVDGTLGQVILEAAGEDSRDAPALPTEWIRPHPKAVYARGSLAEHLSNPVTPLFATLGLRAVNQATYELAEGLDFDALNAEYQYRVINGYVYMGFITSPRILIPMLMASGSALSKMFKRSRERWLEASAKLDQVLEHWEPVPPASLPATILLAAVSEIYTQVGRLYTVLQATTLPAATTSEIIFSRVYRLVRRKHDPEPTVFLYGFDTIAMKADKALFDLAMWVKDQPALAQAFRDGSPADLAAALKAGRAPAGMSVEVWAEWTPRFEAYLRDYGATAYQLDFANPTPVEAPEPALDAIAMYLSGHGQDPHERQRAAVERREQAIQGVLPRLRWPVKGWFQKSLKWAQEVGPAREDSLADLGKANPLVRRLLGELGQRLAAGSAIALVEDIYWLEENEVVSLCSKLEQDEALTDLRAVVSERKTIWQKQLKLTPPAMLPEKSSWARMMPWNRTDQGGNTLTGAGASAGRVTAPACVLLGPADFSKMKPGAVLVAVTTTPAWTPLFAMASAVVTDIGGPLSHSSIVAREYGIPAVMAVGLATRRIRDGQLVTVDGGAGLVILEDGSGNGRQTQ